MNEYLESVKKRDPAAKSILSIILTYPGVKAVFMHKISNFFHLAGFHLIAKIISQGEEQNPQTDKFSGIYFMISVAILLSISNFTVLRENKIKYKNWIL